MKRTVFSLVLWPLAAVAVAGDFPLTSIRSIDGTESVTGGAAGSVLLRAAPADYPGDGSGEEIKQPPKAPNPRMVSNFVAAQEVNAEPNDRYLSDMVWAWGQFLDHDIDLTETSSENGTADIPIEDSDDPLGPNPMLFDRSDFDPETGSRRRNPREQINAITAFIDASNVYGSDATRAEALRTGDGDGAKLKTSKSKHFDLLPLNVDGLPNAGGSDPNLFLAGDVRVNEQVGLTAMHTLFVREHNRLAARIAKKFRGAKDEQIYQLARKIVGAELQIITYNEFLPVLLGPMAPSLADYEGWDETINPGIANEFATGAYRFGHSMLSPNLVLADKNGPFGLLPLRDAFFNPDFLKNKPANVDFLLNGFTFQRAQEVDNMIVDDVRNFLFGLPGAGGLDLASLNIQRGRDHGIPSYNTVRRAYGLARAKDFDDISSDPVVQLSLAAVYKSPDEIDLWVGGLAEDHVAGASVGELVGTVLAEQFIRLRDGDPFFFLNDPDLARAELETIIDLEGLRLSDVIRLNTSIENIPKNVFLAAH